MNVVLWIIQVLLALLFLMAGIPKLYLPISALMQGASPNAIVLPGWFIRFIGVCEVLGALGLILPGVFKNRQFLTTWAALGLAIIMAGAVVVSVIGDGLKMAVIPFVTLLLLLFVAYGRSRVAPLGGR
jgi:uncharacterized membrane protein YphA (DoxX/SURF4 family)